MRRMVVLVTVPALTIAALGWITLRSQETARDLLTDRYASRVEAGATFIDNFIADRQQEELRVAFARFSRARIDADEFNLAVEALGFEAAVLLDEHGRLLAVYPARPEILGSSIARRYEHLSEAVAGRRAVSGVVPSAARGIPVVAFAVPYATPHGGRVFSGAFSVEVEPLGHFLRNMLTFETGRSYLVDADANVAATSEEPRNGTAVLTDVEPDLRVATATTARSGRLVLRGRPVRYFSLPVSGTPWRLISHVDEAELYQPLRGANARQWTVFAVLILVGAVAVRLFRRLERSRSLLQQRVAEQERLNKALEGFSARAAHDLRSPLAAMQMALDLLDAPGLPAERREQVWLALRNRVRNATSRVEELLELARASGTARRSRIDLPALVEDVVRECPGVHVSIEPLPATLDADPVSLRQALLNLVRNAAVHAAADGSATVDIGAEREDGRTILTVSDRGPGIPEDKRARLFDPFVRASDKPGTGLGLAIVGATADAHGGRAWVEERPGGGATFKIAIADA